MEYTTNNNLFQSTGTIDGDMALFFNVQETMGGENAALASFPQTVRERMTQMLTAEQIRFVAGLCETNQDSRHRIGYVWVTIKSGKVIRITRVRRATQRSNKPTGRAIAGMVISGT